MLIPCSIQGCELIIVISPACASSAASRNTAAPAAGLCHQGLCCGSLLGPVRVKGGAVDGEGVSGVGLELHQVIALI